MPNSRKKKPSNGPCAYSGRRATTERPSPISGRPSGWVLLVSALGYCGAGLYALLEDPIRWSYVVVYGGPIALIFLGLALREVSLRVHETNERGS